MSEVEFTLVAPRRHPCYPGHFPEDPIVPGALLLQWLCCRLAELGYPVHGIRSMKFLAPLRPGERCLISAGWQGGAGRLALRLVRDDGTEVARGVVLARGTRV